MRFRSQRRRASSRWLRQKDHDGEEIFPGEAAQKKRSGGGRGTRGAGPGGTHAGHQRLRELQRLRERHLLREYQLHWKCPRHWEQRGAQRAPEAEEHRLVFRRLGLRATGACTPFSRLSQLLGFRRNAGDDRGGRGLSLTASAAKPRFHLCLRCVFLSPGEPHTPMF